MGPSLPRPELEPPARDDVRREETEKESRGAERHEGSEGGGDDRAAGEEAVEGRGELGAGVEGLWSWRREGGGGEG